MCAIYFVFGVVCAFFGYRCFKAIMFLYGFIFGSIVVYLICVEEKVLPGMDLDIDTEIMLTLSLYRMEQCSHRYIGRTVVRSDHDAGPVRRTLHVGIPQRTAGRPGGVVLCGALLRPAHRLAHPRGPPRHRPRLRPADSLLSSKNFLLLPHNPTSNIFSCRKVSQYLAPPSTAEQF